MRLDTVVTPACARASYSARCNLRLSCFSKACMSTMFWGEIVKCAQHRAHQIVWNPA